MTDGRTLIVGGLSSVHDPLLAAALRGAGWSAESMHARTNAGLRRARALGNHGQCNPAHYAVGAVLEHARRSGLSPARFCRERAWLTVGSCGPCRLAAFPHEYARVLRGAGLEALPVVLIDQLGFVPGRTSPLGGAATAALVTALVAGDVVLGVSHRLRPYAVEPADAEALGRQAVADLTEALECRSPLEPPLARLRSSAAAIELDRTRVLPRVLLVGEPWTTLADGDPSYDLARRLALLGAEVSAPTATDWLRYRLWDESQDAPPASDALARADATIRATWARLTEAAGLDAPLADLDELAELARPHYDPRLRGGSAHLEVGRALAAARDRSAHLVLSLKPFGCLPSSSLSDGILSVLLRGPGAPRVLALETTGDADATAESRVEMALHAATRMAIEERARCGA